VRSLLYLGLVNAWRNIGRSLLAVLAMALAAMLMTGSLTLGEGYTAQRAWEYRAYLGGDVLVYPDWTWPTESNVANVKKGEVGMAILPRQFGSPLLYFHPDYYTSGYLTADPEAPTYSMFRTVAQMDEVVGRLTAHEGVTWAEPFRTVPIIRGRLQLRGGAGESTFSLSGFYLRSCPPNLLTGTAGNYPEQLRLSKYTGEVPPYVIVAHGAGEILADKKDWESGVFVTRGSALSGSGDEPLAIVNRRAVIGRDQIRARSVDLSGGGQRVSLTVPSIVPGDPDEGRPPYFDFSRPVTVEIKVVGTYDAATRLLDWVSSPQVSFHEQLYLEAPEFLLNPAAFDKILADAGLPEGQPPPVGALLLGLEDQSKAEEAAGELREAVPGYSVVTVARETAFANARLLPEPIYECPVDYRPRALPLRQPAIPADAGNIFGIVLFCFAGLVVAGNSTLMVLSRRTEFAILRAIGMRGFEIGLVVMVEVLTLSVIGLLAGFGAAEVGNLPVILTNAVGLGPALKAVALDFAVVALATLSCAVVFSLVPVSKTLRITVSEAMRGNG